MLRQLLQSLPKSTQQIHCRVSLPSTYRRLVAGRLLPDFRKAAEVRETPMPQLKSGELLCRVLYAAVNASDRLKTNGFYGDTEPGFGLGIEALAQIVAVGPGVPGSLLGKFRVVCDTGKQAGMYSEYVVSHMYKGISIPVSSANPKYAATAVTGMSTAVCMATDCTPKKGQNILITAAAGSGGTFAVQLAKQRGAHVIGTCGSDDKAVVLKEIGCDRVINYRTEDMGAVLASEYTNGLNWVLENVGGSMLDLCVDHLAHRGVIVAFGFVSEHEDRPTMPNGSVSRRLIAKSGQIRGFAMEHNMKSAPIPGLRLMRDVSKRRIRPVVDPKVFQGIEAVADAVDHHGSGQSVGKVLIKFADPV